MESVNLWPQCHCTWPTSRRFRLRAQLTALNKIQGNSLGKCNTCPGCAQRHLSLLPSWESTPNATTLGFSKLLGMVSKTILHHTHVSTFTKLMFPYFSDLCWELLEICGRAVQYCIQRNSFSVPLGMARVFVKVMEKWNNRSGHGLLQNFKQLFTTAWQPPKR